MKPQPCTNNIYLYHVPPSFPKPARIHSHPKPEGTALFGSMIFFWRVVCSFAFAQPVSGPPYPGGDRHLRSPRRGTTRGGGAPGTRTARSVLARYRAIPAAGDHAGPTAPPHEISLQTCNVVFFISHYFLDAHISLVSFLRFPNPPHS